MPFTLTFENANIGRLTSDGDVSVEDVKAAARELYADPRLTNPTRVLWDLRRGRGTLSQADIRRLISFFQSERPQVPGRSAILAPDNTTFGLGRMFEQLADGDLPVEIGVFRDPDAAVTWLSEDEDAWPG